MKNRKNRKTEENATIKGCSELVVAFVVGMVICFVISVCTGCKPQKELITEKVEVPVVVTQEHHTENVRVDVVRDTIRQRDSVVYRDSIYHYIKGDTTIIERWHYVTNNHHYTGNNNNVRVDTLFKVDSVQVPVITEKVITKVEKVEKPLKWWQKCLMYLGGLLIIASGLLVAYRVGIRKK